MGQILHLLVFGILIQLLIFIEPQVGARAETLVFDRRKDESESIVKVRSSGGESGNEILKNNITRSKLWSPHSTVSSLLALGTTIYEDQQQQQQTNQKIVVNHGQSLSYPSQGPLISNIRHYKSRKSFSRVKTTSFPLVSQLTGGGGPEILTTTDSTTSEKKVVEINRGHDWQGDEAIPTASSHSKNRNENEGDGDGSIPSNLTSLLYGKLGLSGRVLTGNFTKTDRIKSLLSQNKSSTIHISSKSTSHPLRHPQLQLQNPWGGQLLNNTLNQPHDKFKDDNDKNSKSEAHRKEVSKNDKHKYTGDASSRKLHGQKANERSFPRKPFNISSLDHDVENSSEKSNPLSAYSLPHDYQSASENQNFDESYYDIGDTVITNKKPTANESPVFVPGIFPTFYEDINSDREDKVEVYEEDSAVVKNGENGSSSPESSYPEPERGVVVESEQKKEMDIVSKFLRIIEERTPENCTAGVNLTLGQGVVDRYAQDRFRLEAEVAVNRANMLTRLWKYAPNVMESEYLLHASLLSIIEFDDDIFAAGNCYDKLEYKKYKLFCPFAHRLPEGTEILVKDLAIEYNYLTNASEFFFGARKSAERIISNFNRFRKGYHDFPYNDTAYGERTEDIILNVTYEDGKWSMPYFDCGGGNIWMMTYTVPFFGFKNSTYYFKGTSGIDIDLRRVDIDQCPIPENSTELNIFSSSDKCKPATTKCVPIKGLGFRRGSYRCECRTGFYFPNISSSVKYFNGSLLEEEYENKFMRKSSRYDEQGAFECLSCPSGCEVCVDDRPCVVTLNWLMRTAILILQSAIILMLPLVGLFTWKYSEVKVVRAASPLLLRFIVLGAFFIYCTTLVMYPSPSVITCTLQVWLREIGFSLAYGALMLKTWRISVIFRVRSAKAVKITDLDLMKRLGIIVGMFTVLLAIRTLVAPPVSIVSLTSDDLKAWLCKSDWWDHSFTIMELSFLVWGIRLCIVVRKAPSEFNESKFISLAIYNEFLLSLFLNISMLFLQSPANPDLLYIIFFCHVQLTMTLLLCLIFGSKAYMVFRGHGKGGGGSDESRVPTAKFINKGRPGQSAASAAQNSTGMNCRFNASISTGHEQHPSSKFPEDVQEEFRRLYSQLEELKERNMRLGNRHLVDKITAMQEAADNMFSGETADVSNGAQQKQIVVASSSCPLRKLGGTLADVVPATCSSTSNSRGKSMGILSDISEDENPSSSSAFAARTAAGATERLGTCHTADNAAGKRSISIPPQTLSTTTLESNTSLPLLPLPFSNLETTTTSEGEMIQNETPSSQGETGIASPSENEVQIGDDELVDRDKDLDMEEEVDEPRVTNDSNGDCDNNEEVRTSRSFNSSRVNAKGSKSNTTKTTSSVEEKDEDLTKQTENEKQSESSNNLASVPSDAQDPNSTASKTGENSPSKMILDLNDKSRFTEEITV